jgi:DNA-binding MarR family transcriptional regulator
MDRTGFLERREEIAQAFEAASVLLIRHLADGRELSPTSAMVLSTLREEGAIRLTALAAAVGVRQPSMTELVQRLERAGLVTRVSDPADGRGTLVRITDVGCALLVDRRQARREALGALLMTVSSDDEAALTHALRVALPILHRLIDNAKAGYVPNEPVTSGSLHEAREDVLSGATAPALSHQEGQHDG